MPCLLKKEEAVPDFLSVEDMPVIWKKSP